MFWAYLWRHPQAAYALGGVSMMLGIGAGWLAMRAGTPADERLGFVLAAAFLFAFWSLLTATGAMATSTAALVEAMRQGREAKRPDA